MRRKALAAVGWGGGVMAAAVLAFALITHGTWHISHSAAAGTPSTTINPQPSLSLHVYVPSIFIASTQNGTISGSFQAQNAGTTPVGDIFYVFSLYSGDYHNSDFQASATLLDTKRGTSFSVDANTKKTVSFSYKPALGLHTVETLEITLYTQNGVELGSDKVAVEVPKIPAPSLNIHSSPVYLTDGAGTQYPAMTGVTFSTASISSAAAHFVIENPTKKLMSVRIQAQEFNRNFPRYIGTHISTDTYNLQPKQTNDIAVPIADPAIKSGGSYLLLLSAVNASDTKIRLSNIVEARYVLPGTSATIMNSSLDKPHYQPGDTAKVNVSFVGPADMGSGQGLMKVDLYNGNNLVSQSAEQVPLTPGLQNATITFPVNQNLSDPRAVVTLQDAKASDNQMLSSYNTSKPLASAAAQSAHDTWMFYAGGVLVILIVLIDLIFLRRGRNHHTGGSGEQSGDADQPLTPEERAAEATEDARKHKNFWSKLFHRGHSSLLGLLVAVGIGGGAIVLASAWSAAPLHSGNIFSSFDLGGISLQQAGASAYCHDENFGGGTCSGTLGGNCGDYYSPNLNPGGVTCVGAMFSGYCSGGNNCICCVPASISGWMNQPTPYAQYSPGSSIPLDATVEATTCSNATISGTVTFSGSGLSTKTVTQNLSTSGSSYNSLFSGDFSSSMPAPTTPGTYTVNCNYTVDMNFSSSISGNRTATTSGSCGSAQIIVPDNAITVSCSANPSSAQTNQWVTFSAQASGGSGTLTYNWSGAVSGGSQSEGNSFSYPGTQTAYVTAQDASGNSSSAQCSVVVGTSPTIGGCSSSWWGGSSCGTGGTGGGTTPMSVSCSASPNPVNIGQSVTFSANASGGYTPPPPPPSSSGGYGGGSSCSSLYSSPWYSSPWSSGG